MYTEEVNKIALSNNDDKRLQTFDGITTYPYGLNVLKVCESEMLMVKDLFFEKLQWNSVTTINIKMISFHDYVNGIAFNENKTEHNKNWLYIPDHPCRILTIGGSGSGKTKCIIEFNRKPTRQW